ncbi:MAG: hypothetical protein AAFN30_15850, partial [Actinomycetota bacterium]
MVAVVAVIAQGVEAQQTEQVIAALIVLLLVVAALLTVLTVWYWRHTSPRRVERRVGRSVPLVDADDPRYYQAADHHDANGYDHSHDRYQSGGYGYYEEQSPTAVQPRVLGHQ